jgi:hypothetical protein
MTIPTSIVSASLISLEFGRSYNSYMSIWHARNGYYGSINRSGDQYPGGVGRNTNSGYAFSDWFGYNHRASQARVNLFQTERNADADTRATQYHWNGSYFRQSWQWGTTTLRPWFYMPAGQRCDILYDNNIAWGSSWTTADRRYYTNFRGYLVNVREPARNFRNYVGPYTLSGEQISVYNRS